VADRSRQRLAKIDVGDAYGYLYLPLETINPLGANPKLNQP